MFFITLSLFYNINNMEVKYKKWSSSLNYKLLIQNKKEENVDVLKEKYIEMFKYFEKLENTDNYFVLNDIMQKIEEIEFEMQELWGFKKDRNMHRYWFDNGVCSCPRMDNYDNLGTPYRIYHSECVLHGDEMRNMLNREKKLKRIKSKRNLV